MAQFNMLEAKTKLSKLVEAVETGAEKEIVLARNGKPVARIVPLAEPTVDTSNRLGIAEGQLGDFDYGEFQALDEEIWKGFYEDPLPSSGPGTERPKRKKPK